MRSSTRGLLGPRAEEGRVGAQLIAQSLYASEVRRPAAPQQLGELSTVQSMRAQTRPRKVATHQITTRAQASGQFCGNYIWSLRCDASSIRWSSEPPERALALFPEGASLATAVGEDHKAMTLEERPLLCQRR